MRLRLLVAVLFALTLSLVLGGRMPAYAADSSDAVATCLQSGRSLSALFLFDRSGSLEQSDAGGVRYDGLKIALRSLAKVSRLDGKQVAVEAGVSAFDNGYYPVGDVVDWTRLNEGSEQDVSTTIDEMIKTAEGKTQPAGGTNFTSALEGAAKDLEDRGASGSCRVLFWFTDGFDEVDTLGGPLCQAGSGLVDRMRSSGIAVVGLQLNGPQLGGKKSSLQALSTGSAPGSVCGRQPLPSDWARGAFIDAKDPAALRRLFGRLGSIVRGCTPQGDRMGRVDPGVHSLSVTLPTSSRITSIRLDAPDGTVIAAAPEGSTSEHGYTAMTQSDDSHAMVTVSFPPGQGAGEWTVTSDPPVAVADMDFCVSSGLHLERVDPQATVNAGGTSEVVYHAVGADGQEANLDVYGQVAPSAGVISADGTLGRASATRRADHIVVSLTSLPTDARLNVKVRAQLTTSSGLNLTPLAVDEVVGLTLSKAFPTIRPITQLDLGAAVNDRTATENLTLVGSPLGATEVCLGAPADVRVPNAEKGQAIAAPSGCFPLAQGESKVVTVSVTPVTPAVGGGSANLPITLRPARGHGLDGRVSAVRLPVVWRYENPKNAVVLVAVVVLASVLSVLLPLVALALANLVTARFAVKGMRAEVVPILVGPDGVRRREPAPNDPDTVLSLLSMAPQRPQGTRRFALGPVRFATKANGLNPFRAPTFLVRPRTPGCRVLSSVPPMLDHGRVALATPGLGFFTVVVVSDTALSDGSTPEVPAELVAIVRDNDVPSASLDALMNQDMRWSTITETWRHEVVEIDLRDESEDALSHGGGKFDDSEFD